MIKFDKNSKITEVQKPVQESENTDKTKQPHKGSANRPHVVDAKVYKVKSAFVNNSVFITLSYVETDEGRRPIEIFINSKDLNRAPEYVVLTRLISAIFRRASDPMFILEELHGIHDPNGGSYRDGTYYHSFYAEVAEVIQKFFYDVNIIAKPKTDTKKEEIVKESVRLVSSQSEEHAMNLAFKICPTCNSKSLKTENGCDSCVSCGYSKCDK